jgi:hypothetical protein
VAARHKTPLRRSRFVPASEQQRAKIAGRRCFVCGESPVDPAHLVPRSLAGRDRPECVVPLCRLHHRSYERGGLELLPYLEPDNRGELAHALLHLGLIALLGRVTVARKPSNGGSGRNHRYLPGAADLLQVERSVCSRWWS